MRHQLTFWPDVPAPRREAPASEQIRAVVPEAEFAAACATKLLFCLRCGGAFPTEAAGEFCPRCGVHRCVSCGDVQS
jgi:membrane protease subunit (stomatin/prohibitin family)